MRKVVIKDILASTDALSTLTGTSIPINTAYKIATVVEEVGIVLKAFEPRQLELYKAYGDAVDGGFKIRKEEEDAFQAKYNELVSEVVDLNIDKITIDMLGDITLSPATLLTLKWLITKN